MFFPKHEFDPPGKKKVFHEGEMSLESYFQRKKCDSFFTGRLSQDSVPSYHKMILNKGKTCI